MATTKSGHVVIDWRETAETDRWGEVVREALIEGHGWRRYSWKLSAIWIDGDWHVF